MLVLLSIGFSLVETVGISAIMPFISVASNPGLLDADPYKKVFDFIAPPSKEAFIIYFGIAIIVFYIFRAVYSIVQTYLLSRFSNTMGRYFSAKVFAVTLAMPYAAYARKNSGDIMGLINTEPARLTAVTTEVMKLITEISTIAMVYAVLIAVNWQMTLILTFILIIVALLFMNVIIAKGRETGRRRMEADRKTYRLLMEALGNFKFVRLKGNRDDLVGSYDRAKRNSVKANVENSTLNAMPKSILESMGFSLLVAAVVFIIARYGDASMVIPVISMYALALYRILPSMHRMLSNVNSIVFNKPSLDIVADMLRQSVEHEGSEEIVFEKSVSMHGVSFTYVAGSDSDVIKNISLEIRRGEKVAVTGESGGGKSTLIDILIGILKPVSGEVAVDGKTLGENNVRSWRRKIGYIPQNIYLFDGTVGENVAYGAVHDSERIKTALQKANIWDFLLTKDGIDTKVGEGGIQLSGGQRQRIGIARAMYGNPEILVLDEATSALDGETEKKIMDEIYSASENRTLIVIAHRLSTVERCDRAIKIDNGEIKQDTAGSK